MLFRLAGSDSVPWVAVIRNQAIQDLRIVLHFIVHISCCHFCFFDTLIRLFPLPENDLIPGVKCFFGFRQAAQVALFSDIFDRCAAAFQADDPLHPVDGFFVKDAVVGLIALARYGCQYNSGWYVLSYGTSRQIVSMYRSSFLLKWSKSY